MEIGARHQKPWTVLIYTSASQDLEAAVQASLEEITQFGTPDSLNVVAQMGARGQVQRYQLHQCQQPQTLEPARPAEMNQPEELRNFLRWGMEKYPAQRYAIVLGGHGAGFAGAITDSQRRHMMSLTELEAALGELPARPELVIFNTCLMAQAEVAAQLQTVTEHMVASQSELKGLGLPLAEWLQTLPEQSGGGQAATNLANRCGGERAPAVSAIDLKHFAGLQQSLDLLAEQILDHPEARQRLLEHIQAQPEPWPHAQDRPLVDQLDLGSLCQAWQTDRWLPEALRRRAAAVSEQLKQVSSAGLSVYAPDRPNGSLIDKIYGGLELSQRTRWDEAINSLAKPG
ncbi:hypothetical protein JST97_00510 [bacterium]|nr:hypothetical protein [bacterium]